MGATDRPIYVIVNPAKFDGDISGVQAEVESAIATFHGASPVWVETTEDDPGRGQTRAAVEAGAGIVCALGGDGTVRVVAAELARLARRARGVAGAADGVALGLLPGGTGNLLARNLGVPHDDLAEAVRVAWTGEDRRMDVGWVTVDGEEPEGFVVMTGLGFDAAVMDDAPEGLKAKVGWAAYVVAAARNLRGDPFSVQLSAVAGDRTDEQELDARMVVVGNCGSLQGGIELAPAAEVDDGILDTVVLTPSSVVDWASVAKDLVLKGDSSSDASDSSGDSGESGSVCRARGPRIEVRVSPPQLVEVDGDVLHEGSHLVVEVEPLALTVRVPGVRTD